MNPESPERRRSLIATGVSSLYTSVAVLIVMGMPRWTSAADDDHVAPQSQDQLRPMLKITWSRGPNLPQGLQDSEGGVIGNTLITVCGFCSGGLEKDNQVKPGIYPRGFIKKVIALDLSDKNARWQYLPEFPGSARQGHTPAIVNDQLYLWGGFNYTSPFCYADGWRLSKGQGGWSWDPLPPLPWNVSSASTAVIGTKIYLFGGADYDGEVGFHTVADRKGGVPRLGARLLVIDTQNLDAGWRELPQCPGTPRFVHSFQAAGGKIYLIGGAQGLPTYTIVDNWKFDPATNRWSRLRDLPIASGNFPKSTNLLFADRYMILPGGYQYGKVIDPDGTTRPPYGKPSNLNPGTGLYNDVFVYDIQTNTFGTADKMPIDNNLPTTVVRGDRIYLLGGETGGGVVEGEYYGHHPDLLLVGRIEALTPR
jgi:N-acetylneuraminic acid mutarotase